MKLLQFNNKSIVSIITETAIIKSSVTAGSTKTLIVNDNNGFSGNDFILIGEIGSAKSEIAQIGATVTLGSELTVNSLVYPHSTGTPIYKIPYDKINFYYAETVSGDKTLLSTVNIDTDDEYTTYQDSVNSFGYLFFTMVNSFSSEESGYSDAFNYDDVSSGNRTKIRDFVTNVNNWGKPLDDVIFNNLCDIAEAEIFSIKRWRFREKNTTFNTVIGQQAYTLSSIGASDLGQLIYATYDGNPIIPADIKTHKNINWNVLTSGIPNRVWEWDKSLYFTPIPSEIKEVSLYYYRNSSGFSDETTPTDVQLPMAIAFRVLQDLWATVDMNKSQYFERRYLQSIQVMKANDIKQVSKFGTLSDNRIDKYSINSQIDNPVIN